MARNQSIIQGGSKYNLFTLDFMFFVWFVWNAICQSPVTSEMT